MKNRSTSLLVALLEIAGLSGATVAIQLVTAAANLFVPFACSADSQPTFLALRNVSDYGYRKTVRLQRTGFLLLFYLLCRVTKAKNRFISFFLAARDIPDVSGNH
jgi:hypothetical protein